MKGNKTSQNKLLRNIAIISHVDHGKTTLVDFMLRQSGTFRTGQKVDERIMDSLDLERERGITIAAKNCAIYWQQVKINIVDTPGHADFGGEVERALTMVNGAILLVDASEGVLPQTRFVLKKALESNIQIIVVINKIDRKDRRPQEVLDQIYELFMDLEASNEQIDFPVLYAIGREGIAQHTLEEKGTDLGPLFQAIIEQIPPPSYDPAEPFQMLVSDLGYSDYMGRLAIGRVFHGTARCYHELVCMDKAGHEKPLKVTKLQIYDGLKLKEVEAVQPGDIIVLSGIENVQIGDTICSKETPRVIKSASIDEPTLSMMFTINTSPFSGKEGQWVQSVKIRERLLKETLRNVAIRVLDAEVSDTFIVQGRGEFQMTILMETMRREGFEFMVGRPKVIFKYVNDKQLEPMENVYIECDEVFVGIVTEKLSSRKGRLLNLNNKGTGRVLIEFLIPSRGLLGYRNEFLTDTKGTGLISAYLSGFEEYRGDFSSRTTGSIVSDREGKAVAYALHYLEPRGVLFVVPGDSVYAGMIVGEHNRPRDIYVNATKEKKLSNMRSSTKDHGIILTPILPMTLEKGVAFIKEDERLEVTPKSIRLRKAILPVLNR